MSGYKGNKGRESEDRRSRARNEEREPCVTGGRNRKTFGGNSEKLFERQRVFLFGEREEGEDSFNLILENA